jgi:hypothetical protein
MFLLLVVAVASDNTKEREFRELLEIYKITVRMNNPAHELWAARRLARVLETSDTDTFNRINNFYVGRKKEVDLFQRASKLLTEADSRRLTSIRGGTGVGKSEL